MAKTILFAVAMLLLGAAISNGITRYNTQQHQHARAVMVLAQFHLDRLTTAAKAERDARSAQTRLLRGTKSKKAKAAIQYTGPITVSST